MTPQPPTLIVKSRDGRIHQFFERGILNLYHIYSSDRRLLLDAEVKDKVVGIGAAAVMVLGGVKSVETAVISERALGMLLDASIAVRYGEVVPQIINRRGDDRCPLEKRLDPCKSADEMWPEIDLFASRLL